MSIQSANDQNSLLDPRDIRAAKESMTVVREAPGMARVYSGETSEYLVCIRAKVCECPGFEYQDGKCKHIRRVEMMIGDRPIPDLPGRTDVELMLDVERQPAPEPEVRTDGGVATDNVQVGLDGRPDACDCLPSMDTDDIGCWPCYRAGFKTANPNATEDEEQ